MVLTPSVRLVSVIFFAFLLADVAAQQKRTAKTVMRPGVLSGRVFAITTGGDIKPARMADVYLLYVCKSAEKRTCHDVNEYKTSAGGSPFTAQEVKRLDEFNKWLSGEVRQQDENGSGASESLVCRKELIGYDGTILETMKWAEAQNKIWQVIVAQADEEGTFKITVPHPGAYKMLIRGKAGLNDAFWTDDIVVNPGVETKVKLSSPEKACLKDE